MSDKLAIVVSNNNKNVTAYETIDAIKRAGFKNVFIQWYDAPYEPDQAEQMRYAKEVGLNVIFAHLGYEDVNRIWVEGEEGEAFVGRYIKNLDDLHALGIKTVCMHLQGKNNPPAYSEIGFNRLKKVFDHAKELGMEVGLENCKVKGYLEYVRDNYNDNSVVGFCYDSGHMHCFWNDDFDMEHFKDNIKCVHIHDNDGTKDTHLIPFDGTLDWEKAMHRLYECGYRGPITMEQTNLPYDDSLSIDEFYKRSYEAGLKLLEYFK